MEVLRFIIFRTFGTCPAIISLNSLSGSLPSRSRTRFTHVIGCSRKLHNSCSSLWGFCLVHFSSLVFFCGAKLEHHLLCSLAPTLLLSEKANLPRTFWGACKSGGLPEISLFTLCFASRLALAADFLYCACCFLASGHPGNILVGYQMFYPFTC